MAAFYGSVQGKGGEVHRLGSLSSGLTAVAGSWSGGIEVRLWYSNSPNEDEAGYRYSIAMIPWYGVGDHFLIAEGAIGEENRINWNCPHMIARKRKTL